MIPGVSAGSNQVGASEMGTPQLRFDERGVETGATGDLVKHHQTKGAATDMVGLQPLRHTPALPT